MLHVGTLIAVIIVFRKTIRSLFVDPLHNKKLQFLIIASIPTFIIAFVVKFFLPESLLGGQFLAIGFALTIALLVLSKFLYRPRLRLNDSGFLPIVICGVVQGVAVLPGLSRSGSTISTLKLFGIENTDSGEFSFLLSIPVILASGVVEGVGAMSTPINTSWYVIIIGVVCAFLSGYVAVISVMKVLKKDSFLYFALYLLIPLILSLIIL
jgi:undecaprenyl-diphosphatase